MTTTLAFCAILEEREGAIVWDLGQSGKLRQKSICVATHILCNNSSRAASVPCSVYLHLWICICVYFCESLALVASRAASVLFGVARAACRWSRPVGDVRPRLPWIQPCCPTATQIYQPLFWGQSTWISKAIKWTPRHIYLNIVGHFRQMLTKTDATWCCLILIDTPGSVSAHNGEFIFNSQHSWSDKVLKCWTHQHGRLEGGHLKHRV